MSDTTFDLDALASGPPAQTLLRLRLLDRRLSARIGVMDARVDELLRGEVTDEAVSAVDVLCAAIAEPTDPS
jgi:hypothetical protein